MREPSRSTDTSERGRQWRGELRRFRACDPRRSGLQLGLTLLLFLAGSYAALRLGARSWWQGTLLGLAVSPLWVRLFILQHDLGHGSLFRSRRLCHVLGSLLGVITMTPFFRWRKTHAAHHATSGNLDERRPDRDIFTMTVAEYRAAPAWTRAWYRAFRHPLVLFGVVPSFVFMLEQRFAYGPHVRWRERASTWLTNVCWLGIGIALQRTVGLSVALRVIAPMVAVAGGSGIWLFYVQHQFPNAYWQPKRSWRFDDASLLGSSYLRLPAVLRWLTANIGLHHVHHLDPLIPNYRLREAHASQPALAAVPTFGLADAWRLTPVDLWDEQTGRMVRFAELERDPRGDFVAATRAYRADVLSALRACGGWTEAAKNATRAATQRLRQARRDLLSPSLPLALWTSFKTIAFVLGPLLLADRLWQHGAAWATVPLLLVAGMACYGAVAVVHDLAHGSFLRSRRLNDAVGYLVAPLLLMQYGGFKRSHLGHHRHSQSTADPKRFGATHSPEANAPGYRTLDHSEPFLKLPVRLGHAVASFPPRVRQFLYLCVAPVFIGPAVIFFGGEFSVVRRNFRLRESWLATAQSLAWGALLYTWSPSLLGLFAVSLLIGYSFVFYVFAAHLSPNQVYWTSERRTEPADALNVSDVSCGALLRWLGNGFSDHHSTHHLSPSVPCYRLARAARLVTPELAQLRAPALDLLDPEACAVLYGNYFRAIVQTNAEAWDYTEHGALRNLAPPGP